jgi:hypothetical protein
MIFKNNWDWQFFDFWNIKEKSKPTTYSLTIQIITQEW